MGEKFKKWVEESTEGQYVPMGSKCDLCGRKLGFFATGFWSCNTKHLYDGKLCSKCAKKIEALAKEMHQWMPQEQLKKWKRYADYNWQSMSLEQVRALIALKEQNDNDQLEAYGGNAEALLQVQKTFRIEPKLLQVGIFRVEKLKNKMVAFGRVDQGVFRKGDTVRIDHGSVLTESSILEVYVYDPDVPENDFEVCLRASGGKQRLSEEQVGWLILDYEGDVFPNDRIVK